MFCEESFGENHTINAQIVHKDIERSRNESVHESYSLKASLHEISNEPYASSDYGNADKTLSWNDQTPHIEKIKNVREQTFEGEGNNMQSDEEDTQRKQHEK